MVGRLAPDRARWLSVLLLAGYAAIPFVAIYWVTTEAEDVGSVVRDVALCAIPMILLTAVTWRLVWPKWKLFGKLLVHPSLYAILSLLIGPWCILVAWIHQGVFGLGAHIWFSRRHGFTWYAVEDPERYVELSKRMVGFSDDSTTQPGGEPIRGS